MCLIENFLLDLNSNKAVSKSTSNIYMSDLKQLQNFFNNSVFKDMNQIEKLKKEDLSIYFDNLKTRFKPKTVKRKISVLKNFYNYLIRIGVLSTSPLEDIQLEDISDENIEYHSKTTLSEKDCLNILTLFFNSEDNYSDNYESIQNYLITKLIIETNIDIHNIFNIKTLDLTKYEFKQIISKKKNKIHIETLNSELTDELKNFYNAFKDLYASNIESEKLEFFSISLMDYRKNLSEKGKILNINISPRDFKNIKNIKNIKDEHIFEKIKEQYFQIGIGDD